MAVKPKDAAESEKLTQHKSPARPKSKAKSKPAIQPGKNKRAEQNDFAYFPADILSNIGIGIYIVQNGKFAYVSPLYQKQAGYAQQELIGRTSLDYVHPDDREKTRLNAIKALKREISEPYEYRFIKKSREVIHVLEMVTSVTYKGKPAALGSFMDITERKYMENSLRQNEEKYRNILENIEEGYFEVDLSGKFTLINDAVCRVTGYTRDELLGMDNRQYTDPKDLKEVYQTYHEVYSTGIPVKEFCWRLTNKDGSKKYIAGSISLTKDPVGNPTGFRGISRDTTERKRIEDELRRSELAFRSIFESSPVGIATIIDRKFVQVNPALCKITGYSPGDLIGRSAHIGFRDREEYQRAGKILDEQISQQGKGFVEARMKRKNGEDFDGLLYLSPIDRQDLSIGYEAIIMDITERKQAEEALKAANKQMRDIINFLPDATLITVGNKVIAWNRAMEELTGISMEEMTGQEYSSVKTPFFSELLNPTGMNDPELKARYSSVIRIGSIVHAEAFVPSFYQNRGAHVFAAISPLLDGEGNVIGHIESIRDITKQKQAEEKLYKEEQRFRILTEHSPDIIILVNREGKIIYENPTANKILGLDIEKRIGQSVLDNVHPDDLDFVLGAFHLLIEDINTPVQKSERRVRDSQGLWRTFEVVANNLVLENKVDAIIVNLRDITDRKKAEEDLFIIKAAVESSSDAIGLSDPAGRHFYHNKAFTQLFEYTPEELHVMESGREIYADKDAAKKVFDTIIAGGSWSGEIDLLTKSGKTFPVLLRADAVRDDRGKIIGLLGLHTDITERRRADEEREKLQAQLTQAHKMESVGRLAGGIAHDFNNMLGVILGRAEIALTRIDAAQPIYKDLQEIRKAAERSANLTRQLLAFARRQTVVLKILDLNETVEGMLKMIRRLIGENIELAWLPDNVLLPVKMDPGQIDQILANLCVNARDAIAGMGKITIETAAAVFDRAFCSRHVDFLPGDFVMIAVSDNGSGMDKATMDKLFEPFFTTKDVGRGTGLGLATVYGIVKQNGGFINVYSEKGRGTTFRIYLPRHAGKAEQFHKEEKTPTVSGTTVVLLVEDEPAILEMATMMLERLGYTVLAAKMPGEAIELAQKHTGNIHLLMTDVVMPEMNGRDLANHILTLYPAIKRLFMSGYTADVIAHQGVLDAGVHFIQKPFTINDLAAKLRDTLDISLAFE